MTPTQRAAAERLAKQLDFLTQPFAHDAADLLRELAAEPAQAPDLVRDFPAVKAAKKAAEAELGYYRKMMAAEPVQDEPVAWLKTMYSGTRPILEVDHRKPPATNSIPVYAAPQQPMRCPEDGGECGAGGYCRPEPQQRKPLSDEQIRQIVVEASTGSAIKRDGSTSMRIARAIERAHGITGEPT